MKFVRFSQSEESVVIHPFLTLTNNKFKLDCPNLLVMLRKQYFPTFHIALYDLIIIIEVHTYGRPFSRCTKNDFGTVVTKETGYNCSRFTILVPYCTCNAGIHNKTHLGTTHNKEWYK